MAEENQKAVKVFLRVKGPPNPTIKPSFSLEGPKIRFKRDDVSQQEDIMDSYTGKNCYYFDKLYRDDCHQSEIFEDICQDMIQSAIQGYNGTIFAYGQTGTGKTYTMTGGKGDPEDMGLIPRTLISLFEQAEIPDRKIKVKLQYLQIYNNCAYDLFDTKSKRSNNLFDLKKVYPQSDRANSGFFFPQLSEFTADTYSQAFEKVKMGEENRIMRKTESNDQSSRSHTLLMIKIITTLNSGLQRKALLNLVDLAGSERVHNANSMDEQTIKEGSNINLGLFYLKRVVMMLGKGPNAYVPYRDSLLTMALKSSMGGNCKTRMIATINPEPSFSYQSQMTCEFAMQLNQMQNKIKKNTFIDPWVIVKQLKQEIKQLKDQISLIQGEEVKDVLDSIEIRKIRQDVDKFISSPGYEPDLPIDNRLYIKEYLRYMKQIITNRGKWQKPPLQNPEGELRQEMSDEYFSEIENLKAIIQKRDNEINLLLTIINDKKLVKQSEEDAYIPIEDVEEKKIAESITNSFNNQNQKHGKISIEDVEKHLIKPLEIADEDDVGEAYSKFKDAHLQHHAIQEKQQKIKIREMKRNKILQKMQKLRHERTKINTEILKTQEINSKHQVIPNEEQVARLRKQLKDIEDLLKKKYGESNRLKQEIDLLSLGKNKRQQKVDAQFNLYMTKKKTESEETMSEGYDGSESEVLMTEPNFHLDTENDDKKFQDDEVQIHLQSFLKERNKIFNRP